MVNSRMDSTMGWLGRCSVSNLFVFAPDRTIICRGINYPGLWHDRMLSKVLYQLLAKIPAPWSLAADSVFVQTFSMKLCIL